MAMIRDNVLKIKDNISFACKRLGRDPNEITLIGVTKHRSERDIQHVVDCGVSHIGENRLQQALRKYQSINTRNRSVTRHMIGHLQTNKVKQALEVFDMIQSVDSLRLASAIEKHCQKLKRRVDILVQVNTSGENQKFGIQPNEILSFFSELVGYSCLQVRGLMTVALHSSNDRLVRNCFKKLKNSFDIVKDKFSDRGNINMHFLSMGMTDDYLIAIEEGSNMVRIGRAIFDTTEESKTSF